MTRPAISAKDQVTVAIVQADFIPCPLCKMQLYAGQPRRLEHMVPRKLGGSDLPENLRWVHLECALKKDFGNGATCADGDIHKIAKAKRLAKKHSGQDEATPRAKARLIPSRPWPESKKQWPSRPLPKRATP